MVPELIPVLGSQPAGDRSGRLSLLSARPAVTSAAAGRHRPLAGTKLYCLLTEVHVCTQLAQCPGLLLTARPPGFEPATCCCCTGLLAEKEVRGEREDHRVEPRNEQGAIWCPEKYTLNGTKTNTQKHTSKREDRTS